MDKWRTEVEYDGGAGQERIDLVLLPDAVIRSKCFEDDVSR